MRPKKKILALSLDESRRSILTFVLRTNQYNVTAATTIDEARELLAAQSFDLLLCDLPLPCVEELLAWLRPVDPLVRTLIMGAKTREIEMFSADAIFTFKPSAADMLERIKILSARKRGPRKLKKPPMPDPMILRPCSQPMAGVA